MAVARTLNSLRGNYFVIQLAPSPLLQYNNLILISFLTPPKPRALTNANEHHQRLNPLSSHHHPPSTLTPRCASARWTTRQRSKYLTQPRSLYTTKTSHKADRHFLLSFKGSSRQVEPTALLSNTSATRLPSTVHLQLTQTAQSDQRGQPESSDYQRRERKRAIT